MEGLPVGYRLVLRLGHTVAPEGYRDDWRREWTAEISFALRSDRSRVKLFLRTLWCLVDALWLWRRVMTSNGWTKDLMGAIRALLRRPLLSGVMVLTLGLGLGATATIFTVVDGVILEELPVPEPEGLIRLGLSAPQEGIPDWPFSYAQFRELSAGLRTADVAVLAQTAYNLVTDEGPVRVTAVRVSDTFFPLTGLEPIVGRAFTREEEAVGQRVAVVSHAFWQQHLAGAASAIGRSLNLAGEPYRVIGVMPRGARLAQQVIAASGGSSEPIDIYMPMEDFGSRQGDLVSTMWMIGRLTAGSTLEDARAGAEGLLTEFMEARGRAGWLTHVVDLRDHLVRPVRGPLIVILAAAAVLLVMVSTNLCGLVLVRAVGRSGEWAARQALGATRFRIARQLLTEGAVLSCLAGGVALVVVYLAVGRLRTQALGSLPRAEELALDPGTIALALLLVALTSALFGIVPTLATYRRTPASALTSRGRTLSAGGRAALQALVATEVGLAVVLLVGSGLLLRSFDNLLSQEPGYEFDGVLRAMTQLDPIHFPSDEEIARFATEVQSRVAVLPGVQQAAVAAIPSPIQGPRRQFQREGLPGEENRAVAFENAVTPGYFEVMRIEVLEGRTFTDADDRDGASVVIITKTLANELWPGESAVGKRILSGSWRRFNQTGRPTTSVLREVVGVVDELTGIGFEPGGPVEVMFLPMSQAPWLNQVVLVRTQGAPDELVPVLRGALEDIAPDQPFFGIEPAGVDFRDAVETERVSTQLIGGFAASALLLSILGIYGVVSYSVALRRREVGIRMAIGADRLSVSSLFVGDGMRPVIVGLSGGLIAAFFAVRVLRGMLYEVSPLEPAAFMAAGAILGASALLSAFVPSLRTARIDPVEALRHE